MRHRSVPELCYDVAMQLGAGRAGTGMVLKYNRVQNNAKADAIDKSGTLPWFDLRHCAVFQSFFTKQTRLDCVDFHYYNSTSILLFLFLLFSISHNTRNNMAVDEATQVNDIPAPNAGQLNKNGVEQTRWTVESGMS